MKLKDYVKRLVELAKKYPDVEVITSVDDEGNGFNSTYNVPCLGWYDGEYNGCFLAKEYFGNPDYSFGEELTEKDINAVCLN